jgi:predicted lactoylglutathione lyase
MKICAVNGSLGRGGGRKEKRAMVKQIFVNLPVKDLKKTMEFFGRLGFEFNPKFTDDNAACMIVGENIFAMLLVEKFFKTFIRKEIADARHSTEVLVAVSLDSRADVDRMVDEAVRAGGNEPREAQDHGWMYQRCFEDPDGHIWEIFYADESAFNP